MTLLPLLRSFQSNYLAADTLLLAEIHRKLLQHAHGPAFLQHFFKMLPPQISQALCEYFNDRWKNCLNSLQNISQEQLLGFVFVLKRQCKRLGEADFRQSPKQLLDISNRLEFLKQVYKSLRSRRVNWYLVRVIQRSLRIPEGSILGLQDYVQGQKKLNEVMSFRYKSVFKIICSLQSKKKGSTFKKKTVSLPEDKLTSSLIRSSFTPFVVKKVHNSLQECDERECCITQNSLKIRHIGQKQWTDLKFKDIQSTLCMSLLDLNKNKKILKLCKDQSLLLRLTLKNYKHPQLHLIFLKSNELKALLCALHHFKPSLGLSIGRYYWALVRLKYLKCRRESIKKNNWDQLLKSGEWLSKIKPKKGGSSVVFK